MRLRQIRISGFKSFADLTTIDIPSSIIGIVGPNGCGKSNVIEAVRWALGEGKASDLRCKSMSELIFAGSDTRKQAGRAMVELVFDNTDHTLSGPWGAYSEISVKRLLTRDNTSSYLINNQQVRATDVRELFMGTGLGANSYAIISQGMVTEFAKDTPEKRREYLEEAAGVSKYKKRRREAESNLARTRSNLERVSDLQITRREGIKRLEAEAEVARRYQELQTQRTAQETLWWFVQCVDSQDNIDRINAQVAEAESKVNAFDRELRQTVETLEALRKQLSDANITVLGRTQSLAAIDRDISSVEGNIRSIIERRALMQAQIESYKSLVATREEEAHSQRLRMAKMRRELEEKEELIATADERQAQLEEVIETAQAQAETLRLKSDAAQARAAQIEKDSTLLSSEIARLSKTKEELRARIDRFKRELAQADAPDEARYLELKEEAEAIDVELEECLVQREDAQAALEESNELLNRAQADLRSEEQKHAKTTARLLALKDLEEKAVAGDKLTGWLQKQGLGTLQKLFELLDVDSQWARAVEAVLRERVNALGISRLSMAGAFSMVPPPVKLTFYANSVTPNDYVTPSGLVALADKVHFDVFNDNIEPVVSQWLHGYAVIESVDAALKSLDRLPEGWRYVTPEGHVVDAVSINFWADDDQSGHLARRAELHQFQELEEAERRRLEALHEEVGNHRLKVSYASETVRKSSMTCDSLRTQSAKIAVEVTRLQAAIDAYKRRSDELSQWLEETKIQFEDTQIALEEADERFGELDETLAQLQDQAQEAKMAWEVKAEALRQAEQNLNVFNYTQREIALTIKTLTDRLQDAQRAEMVAQSEHEEMQKKLEQIAAELQALDENTEREGLQRLLTSRDAAQAALTTAQEALSVIERQDEELEARRQSIEEGKRAEQHRMGDFITRRQQFEVQLATVKTRLDEMMYDEGELRERYEIERPKATALRSEVERLARAMAALGAVNHAALEQLTIEKREVERIDAEVADLQKAIETIEAAITRIDSETRSLLMDTYNRVNKAFNDMFVKLFGGGQARLEMTSDDVLEAGLEMYANPPGKHNHSIRQLSGGELALTATALVFAFFTLNPAPFCLLDEVDAPLDEANQARLAGLIGSMSANTQFMMITHHRVTMEHTHQMIGVTMKERGVSRVVSVDFKEAAQYIQKA